MTELAARAGVPIGSLYQYFPDKAAILRTLAARFMESTREMLLTIVSDIKTVEDALANVDFAVDGYYATIQNEPIIRDVWSGTQSDKVLQALDIEDSRENGEIFYEGLKRFVDPAEHVRFRAACFLIMQMTGAATRLAIAVDREEGDLLITEFRRLVRRELTGFFG
jgi:AcrR family transcriptional regulator